MWESGVENYNTESEGFILKYRNISHNIRKIYGSENGLMVFIMRVIFKGKSGLEQRFFCTTSCLFTTFQTHKDGAFEPLFYGQLMLCLIFVPLEGGGAGVTT